MESLYFEFSVFDIIPPVSTLNYGIYPDIEFNQISVRFLHAFGRNRISP